MIVRTFSKGVVLALETVGLLVLVLLAAVFALMLRLQQGPLPLDFLTERLEKAFAGYQNGFVFDIAKTTLIWGGQADPFMLEMRDVRVHRSDQTPVAVIGRARVVLSKRSLVFGQIIPKEFYLYNPVVRVVRSGDGAFSLNVGHGGVLPTAAAVEKAWDDTVDETRDVNPVAQQQYIASLLERMRNQEWHGLLGGLKRITIDDAALAYDDRMLGVVWRVERAKIVLARVGRGLVADTVFEGDFGAGASAPHAVMRLRASHLWDTAETKVEAFFTGVNPAVLARQSDTLSVVRDIDVALKGRAVLTLDETMHPAALAVMVGSDAGRLNAAELYPAPVDITGFVLDGDYDIKAGRGRVNDLRINFGGPQVRAAAQLERVIPHTAADGTVVDVTGHRLVVQGTLMEMPMDDLGRYWPEKLAGDAQKWVTQNLKAGVAHTATIDLSLVRAQDGAMSVETLGGNIDFTGIAVNYFPPMRRVENVSGKAAYDADAFRIKVSGGQLGDIKLTGGRVDITDLSHSHSADRHARIEIAASLAGPLKTALEVIDEEPLKYPSMLGLKTGGAKGQAQTEVTFAFPLHHALHINEVEVTAKSQISDAELPDVALGQSLRGGPFALTLEKGQLRVKGDGRFGDAAIMLDWTKNFTDPAKPAMDLAATLTVPAAMLPVFGVPEMLRPTGFLPARLTLTERQDATATLALEGDLAPLGFSIDAISASKGEGDPGKLALELEMKNNRPQRLRRITVDSPAFSAGGSVDFNTSGEQVSVSRIGLEALRFGATDLGAVAVSVAPGGGAYDVSARGRQLDASSVFQPDDAPNSDADASRKTAPLSLSLQVERLITGPDKHLDAVTLRLMRNDFSRIEQLEMDAMAGGQPVRARYLPAPAGGKTLQFTAGNAGVALAALGVTSAIRGGQLTVEGRPAIKADNAKETARDLAGSVVLSNFEVRGAPVLAKLLNAMSLSGIRDLLNNKGLSFKRARARFVYTDRGQPATDRNQRLIRLADGQTSGASLGLMFEGAIDMWRKVYDINGTIVPVSDLNTLLEKIPLLGDVLTAGGEGIFAATYTITGPQKDPEVSVNPLSVLAPGVLRKIFFEN